MKKIHGVGIALLAVLVAFIFLWSNITGRVDAKDYHVKQTAISGTMVVIDEPGFYWKMFGTIEEYTRAQMFYFSKDQLDGGDGIEAQALNATFMGNSTADVSGICKYRLPSGKDKRLDAHITYGSNDAIQMELIRNAIAGALKQTGPMFRPEEAFITRRAEFTDLVRKQLEDGLYATETKIVQRKEIEGVDKKTGEETYKIIREAVTKMKLSKDGQPIIERPSVLAENGIVITDFVIKDFDFDEVTDANIRKKKEAEQIQVVAKANAEKAKQDAITAKMEGEARIAKAKADEEVIKIQEVTRAEKERDVARLNAEKAKEVALKIKREGEAKAYSAKKLVEAGLTPLKKAQIEKETRIGVARELSKWKGPSIVVSGSGGKGGQSGLGEAMQLKYLMDIDDKFNSKKNIK